MEMDRLVKVELPVFCHLLLKSQPQEAVAHKISQTKKSSMFFNRKALM